MRRLWRLARGKHSREGREMGKQGQIGVRFRGWAIVNEYISSIIVTMPFSKTTSEMSRMMHMSDGGGNEKAKPSLTPPS